MSHFVRAGDLVRVEFLLGRVLQFFTYGIVTQGVTEAEVDQEATVEAIYDAQVPVEFDTIVIPADQIGPGAQRIVIDHGHTRLDEEDVFEFTAILDVLVSPS